MKDRGLGACVGPDVCMHGHGDRWNAHSTDARTGTLSAWRQAQDLLAACDWRLMTEH